MDSTPIQLFNSSLNKLLQDNSWKQVLPWHLSELVYRNLKLIYEQPEDQAALIQKQLLILSDRINEKFNSSKTRHLAFSIQGIALGLFSASKKDWYSLPPEVCLQIFQEVAKSYPLLESDLSPFGYFSSTQSNRGIYRDLTNLILTSKIIQEEVTEVRDHWLNSQAPSLKSIGFERALNAINFIKEKKLLKANLANFYLIEDRLQRLSTDCAHIDSLSMGGLFSNYGQGNCTEQLTEKILVDNLLKFSNLKFLSIVHFNAGIDDQFAAALKNFTQLESLNLNACKFSGAQFPKALKSLTNLTALDLGQAKGIPEDTFIEALKNLSNLTSLTPCYATGENLALALEQLTKLQNLDFTNCSLPESRFIATLSHLTNLKSLDLTECEVIRGPVFAELALPHLRYLNLSYNSAGKFAEEIKQKNPLLEIENARQFDEGLDLAILNQKLSLQK